MNKEIPGYFITRLSESREVGDRCFSLIFDIGMNSEPGQFVMVWIPGVDEIPMSISHSSENRIGITTKIVGKATEALCSLEPGDRLRIRGPYGRGFNPSGKRNLLVAGGVGSAPMLPLGVILTGLNHDVTAIIGAKRERELVLLDEFERLRVDIHIATDDGSKGFRGTASDLCRDIVYDGEFDSIYCCGPEPMIKSLMKIAGEKSLPGQASVERYMRCGIGICGSCAIGTKLVCKDGPVFDFSELEELEQFGD